jgi:protein TonB
VDNTPRVNLGGNDSLSNVLVEGDQVIPAGPDPKVHNREPIYPDEAVRRGQQGIVVLLIQVSPEGLPSAVDVARSSGFNLLDRAAREAVQTWRFVPAVRDGQPVPSNMSLRVNFQLD